VQADPAARAELARVGVSLVPAVVVGDRVAHGWNPEGYAALLGVAAPAAERLSPPVLAARLDRILAATQTLLAPMSAEQLAWRPPERDRTVRDLGHHVFRLSLAFVDGVDLGRFPESWLQEPAPPEMRDGGDLARYGALVRGRLSGWFEGAGGDEFERVIDVYYGPQSGHAMLERTTWHAAQHLRQLHDLAGRLGMTPDPLPTDAFEGLPLPRAVW
jgi:hypothetical protein